MYPKNGRLLTVYHYTRTEISKIIIITDVYQQLTLFRVQKNNNAFD